MKDLARYIRWYVRWAPWIALLTIAVVVLSDYLAIDRGAPMVRIIPGSFMAVFCDLSALGVWWFFKPRLLIRAAQLEEWE